MVQQYGDDTKAAVLAALLAGQSVSKVAEEYHIPRTTIIGWRNVAGVSKSAVSDAKKAEFGELIADYLREALLTLSVQAREFRDKAWLEKQPASEAAVLHGVLADKAIRILAALEPEPGAAE